jgi:hypothetical protein
MMQKAGSRCVSLPAAIWLTLSVQEAVGLGKLLILDADAGDAALFQFSHQAAHVVEVAVTGIAVEQYG